MTGWEELDRFLRTDPSDVGCDEALRLLHVYAELVLDHGRQGGARRYAGVAAHLLACAPCADDLEGLVLSAQVGGAPLSPEGEN